MVNRKGSVSNFPTFLSQALGAINMKNNKGFIELVSVSDFWNKLKFDYSILKQNSDDIYSTFNFFLTAHHLIDWMFEGIHTSDRQELSKQPLLKICSQIANGIKHFEIDKTRHNSIKTIEKERYIDEDYIEDDYFESPIIIFLDKEHQSEFGNSIRMEDLAEKLMDFWFIELTKRKLIQTAPNIMQ